MWFKCRKYVLRKPKSNSDWRDRICEFLNETQMHTYIIHTLASTPAPRSSHQLCFTGHMQTVNTVAPLHSLAFCLYFLKQNNGYKSQSGKNKIWCKAQISVPEDWVNWLGGLVKKKKKNNPGEKESIITGPPQLCQCFNNFLQASWPLALVLLHRTKKTTLLIWSQICIMLLSFMGMSAHVDTWAETPRNENQNSTLFCCNRMPWHPPHPHPRPNIHYSIMTKETLLSLRLIQLGHIHTATRVPVHMVRRSESVN